MISFFESDEKVLEIYDSPKQGFYLRSEIINGRIAMIALPILIIIELLTKESIFRLFNFSY